MAYANKLVADCIQFERAFCTAKCPFNLDIRDFIGKLQQGRFNVAYKTYQNSVGFPGIVTALCHEPCKTVCPLKDFGGSISLKRLEKSAIDFARSTEPDQFNMPAKAETVAIVGAGISGLACALRLSTKKYKITVFEKTERIGGHLYNLLPSEIFLGDISRQFKYENYTLQLATEIVSLDDLNFDAIYVATGSGGNDFGLNLSHEGTFASTKHGVFMGGSLCGADTMQAIAQGLSVSGAIETYLKIGKMNHPVPENGTKLLLEAIQIIPSENVLPGNNESYSKEEAIAESKRCLKCSCDACVRHSPLMSYFRKFPKRLTEEVEVTLTPRSLDGNATLATRLLSTCTHCGLCKEVCPKGIDTGAFLLQSHRTMREKGKMPWAFHDFFLQDMAFTNGEAGLSKLPNGYDKSLYMFFPGCQLGASDIRYVTESYRFLLGQWPDTALMLGCCSAPAEWAGDEVIRNEATAKLREDWLALGQPIAIFACPTCKQMFQRHLPEIKGLFLYDLMLEQKITLLQGVSKVTASVFDPCASRTEPGVQQAIRELAERAGFKLEPLPMERQLAQCCSWGGQVSIAHPPYAKHIVKDRITENDNPYIVYCSNCRDIFAAANKPVWHILDILFGLNGPDHVPPTVTERRSNRSALKRQVLEEFWQEKTKMEKNKISLIISPELKQKLNNERILETDIANVVEYCENSGRKLLDQTAGSFSGHLQIGKMTFWAEYRSAPGGRFELVNAYGHRMSIEEA